MAGIGRVSGSMLSSNLDRQGYPLNFVSGTATLLHLDFASAKIGINTTVTTEALTINGNLSTSGILFNDGTISAKNNSTLYIGGTIDLGYNQNVKLQGGNVNEVVVTDGAGNLTWGNVSAMLTNERFLQNITISGASISTNVTDGDLTLYGNGTGSVYTPLIRADYVNALDIRSTTISGQLTGSLIGNVTGNITGNVAGDLTGLVLTSAQPVITSVGELTDLIVTGNVDASSITATSLHGDLNTNNIYGISGNITITPPLDSVLAVNSTTAQILPLGTTLQRPLTGIGAIRYNIDSNVPEYFNGQTWISLSSEIFSQIIYPNGVASTYLLDHGASAEGIIVSINGTMQQPGTAYTVTNRNQLTFTETPQVTDTIEVRSMSSTTIIEIVQQNALRVVSPTVTFGTTETVLDTFRLDELRSCKYTISVVDNVGNTQLSDVFVIHNGTTISLTSAAATVADIAVYRADISGGYAHLWVQGRTNNSTLKLYKMYFPV